MDSVLVWAKICVCIVFLRGGRVVGKKNTNQALTLALDEFNSRYLCLRGKIHSTHDIHMDGEDENRGNGLSIPNVPPHSV